MNTTYRRTATETRRIETFERRSTVDRYRVHVLEYLAPLRGTLYSVDGQSWHQRISDALRGHGAAKGVR